MSLAKRRQRSIAAAAEYKKAYRAHVCCLCGRRGGVWRYPEALRTIGVDGHYAHTKCLLDAQWKVLKLKGGE